MDHTATGNSPKIETVQEQFEAWRSGRVNRREPIPQHLWQAAAELCCSYPISHVSRHLCLSYSDLKKRVTKGPLAPVQFMEIGMDVLAGGWQIECNRPDGSHLRIAGNGQPPAAEMLRTFLS